MEQWLAQLPYSRKVLGSLWVLQFAPTVQRHANLLIESKAPECGSVRLFVCLYISALIHPLVKWRPVQVIPFDHCLLGLGPESMLLIQLQILDLYAAPLQLTNFGENKISIYYVQLSYADVHCSVDIFCIGETPALKKYHLSIKDYHMKTSKLSKLTLAFHPSKMYFLHSFP